MKNVLLSIFAILTLTVASLALANQRQERGSLHRTSIIAVPGNPLEHFDISAFSSSQGVYGFSDRSNHSIDIINAKSDRFLGRAEGFSHGGPNGLVAVGDNQFWAGDGDSKLQIIDIHARKIVGTINTGGKQRVDEIAYDPRHHLVIAANNDDTPPFITFVSATGGHRILGKLTLPQATDGLEQPVWNPNDGLVYLSIPVLNHHKARGGVVIINPSTHQPVGMILVHKCMPAGLALGPNDHLLVGCSDDAVAAGFAPKSLIVDLRTRKVVAKLPEVGGSDEVWYNPGTHRYYLAAVANTGGPALGVVDALHDSWLSNLPTGAEAHSVASDPNNGKVFVPVAANNKISGCSSGCVEVFSK